MGRRYRHLCPCGSPGYLHSSFRRGTGLVSPATSADSATLARVDEFLMNSRRNFGELRKSEVQLRRIYVPRLYENSQRALSLARLTRGVDLLIGYVDLRYGCTFEELAHLSQRTDRREVAPISPVQPLLMVAALSDSHTLGHAARVEALKELNLEPGSHDPLCKKPL